MDTMIRARLDERTHEFVETIHFFSKKNWTPATSSNFSYKIVENAFAISRSGVDKSKFDITDILIIDQNANILPPYEGKSSAETLIHLAIYEMVPEAWSVLHTHSDHATVLSRLVSPGESLYFKDYELSKGLYGNTTHEMTIELPVLPNAQDMEGFSYEVKKLLKEKPSIHGFIMQGHGLYTWGNSIGDAKRHIESFEFLLKCDYMERLLKK